MNNTESEPAADQAQQALIQCLINELTEVPVANAMAPSRTLEIPRGCLLSEWTELY